MKMFYKFVAIVAVALLIAGCATQDSDPRWQNFNDKTPGGRIEVQIDSIAAQNLDLDGMTFVVAPGLQGVEEGDLEFQVVAKYVENAMRIHGAVRAEKPEQAELIVRVAYGIGEPHQISTYNYSTGWNAQSINQTVFTRNLVISGYDAKKPQSQLWKTTVNSTGMSPDLRMVILYLVTMAEPHLGKSTGRVLEEGIADYDPRILDIKFGTSDLPLQEKAAK